MARTRQRDSTDRRESKRGRQDAFRGSSRRSSRKFPEVCGSFEEVYFAPPLFSKLRSRTRQQVCPNCAQPWARLTAAGSRELKFVVGAGGRRNAFRLLELILDRRLGLRGGLAHGGCQFHDTRPERVCQRSYGVAAEHGHTESRLCLLVTSDELHPFIGKENEWAAAGDRGSPVAAASSQACLSAACA